MKKPIIAITMGDPSGIGPELVLKVLSNKTIYDECRPLVVADPKAFAHTADFLNTDLTLHAIQEVSEATFSPSTLDIVSPEGLTISEIRPGTLDPAMGRAAAMCLEKAFRLALEKKIDGVVSAPLNKEAFHKAGYNYLDELAYLAEITGSPEPVIMGVLEAFWTISITDHVPFRRIPDLITRDRVRMRIIMIYEALRKSGKKHPKIAVAALNVHGGEGGLFGNEEIEEIGPAIQLAQDRNINVQGPFPADTVFVTAMEQKFDGVVCMYHDQANIARKLLATRSGVTLFMGLPVPCATTAHGTAFDISGKGVADPVSLQNALKYSVMLAV